MSTMQTISTGKTSDGGGVGRRLVLCAVGGALSGAVGGSLAFVPTVRGITPYQRQWFLGQGFRSALAARPHRSGDAPARR